MGGVLLLPPECWQAAAICQFACVKCLSAQLLAKFILDRSGIVCASLACAGRCVRALLASAVESHALWSSCQQAKLYLLRAQLLPAIRMPDYASTGLLDGGHCFHSFFFPSPFCLVYHLYLALFLSFLLVPSARGEATT